MRKLLLISLFTVSLFSTAQTRLVEKEASFDFHNYQTLTPAVDFGRESVFLIQNIQFTSNDVTFEGKNSTSGYKIVINKNVVPGYCALQFPSYASIVVSVPDNFMLKKIDLKSMGRYDGVGGLILSPKTPIGEYNYGIWTNTENVDAHQIIITNQNGQDAYMAGVKVTYMRPANLLTYQTVSPAIDEETDPFTGYTLTFANPVTVNPDVVFNVKDANENIVAVLTPSVEDNVVTLTPAKPITKAGAYKLVIPENAFENEDTEYNQQMELTFSVKDYVDSFNYIEASLIAGKVKEIPQTIELTFPDNIGSTTLTTLDLLDSEDAVVTTATVAIDNNDASKLLLTFPNAITTLGAYKMTIPEASVKDADETHYNRAVTLEYEVMGYDVPTDELVAKAQELLTFTGVGYPKSQSDARLALAAVVNDENKTLQEYELAIIDFINTDDIIFPQYGKYYTFAKTGGTADTFIGYTADNGVYKTTDADDAEHFLIVDNEGDRFVGMSDGTSARVLLKKAVYDTDPEAAFGLFTVAIEGFNDDIAGIGYKLEQVFSRDPKTTVTVTPADDSRLEAISEIVVTVNEVETISYNAEKPVEILLKGDNEPEVVDVISSIETEGNKLIIKTNILVDGNYILNIPKGAITFYSIDHDAEVDAVTATYLVSKAFAFSYDFTLHYPVYNLVSTKVVHPAEDLNDVTIYSNQTEIFLNPEKCVTYVRDSEGVDIYTGTLEKDENSWSESGLSMLRFKFNTEFNKTTLPNGTYTFVIPEGSFGDANYGAYLVSPDVTTKPNCHLNNTLYWIYNVNDAIQGIETVESNEGQTTIFDLSGRRVKGQVKSGLYIVNGKKLLRN